MHASAHRSYVNALTCFRIYGEVGLSLENAVNHTGTVSIGRVICISSCHLQNRGTCAFRKTSFSMLWHSACEQLVHRRSYIEISIEIHNGFVPLNLILRFIGQIYSLLSLPGSKIEYYMSLCVDNTHIIGFGLDWCLKVKSVVIVRQSQSCDESAYCLLHDCSESQGWHGLEKWLSWLIIINTIKTAHCNHFCHSWSFISYTDS